jgi:hypothetical protein
LTTFDATIGAQVQQAAFDFSAAGDNIIISGILGKSIKVLQFFLVVSAATNIVYKSGSTLLSGKLEYSANAAQVQDFIQLPLTCNPGDNFIINNSAGIQVGGTVWFTQG